MTRPPALSPDEIERLIERVISRGASITMMDSRVTSAQMWFLAAMGTTVIATGAWGIKSINELNQTMTVVVTQNVYRDAHVARIEQHLETVDGRVVILERKAK